MVHFYHEFSNDELYEICNHRLTDIEEACEDIVSWLRENPAYMDEPVD